MRCRCQCGERRDAGWNWNETGLALLLYGFLVQELFVLRALVLFFNEKNANDFKRVFRQACDSITSFAVCIQVSLRIVYVRCF